ncbi:MAG: UDP-glucose/GDP-mannose dehydrogenase family protein [Candidatus Koribacter versatilis]|nr:UDP-glucose/GDP-mannose dehydrogenase family protein [Candidatus Koribacter versatilis]
MHIGVYGSGYLSTVISACLADFGTPVCCCHADSSHIVEVAKGDIPFYEKNLQEVIRRNVRSGRLVYSTDPEDLARKAQVIFLAEDSAQGLEELVLRMARAAGRVQVLSIVTPVRVGTTTALEKALKANALRSILVCQPMFFTNGCAVEDFNWPDRIILGTASSEAVSALKQIFHPLVMRGVPVLVTNYETAELTREATTAFVATKISFINEIASLCEHVRADAVILSLALGLDKKIAPRCLQPGAGMGGIFAETDMESLTGLARENGVDLKILSAAREVNRSLADRMFEKVSGAIDTVQNKDVGILGLAFKPNTNSVAGSASVQLAQNLLAKGARVRAYDPVAIPEARQQLNGMVKYCESAYGVAEGVDALVVGTGWPEFRTLDFGKIRHLLKRPIIIDTKNLLDSSRLRAMGFQYLGVGRK